MDYTENPYVRVTESASERLAAPPVDQTTWPTITEPVDVHWTTPSMEVIVTVMPGENISEALLAAARDEVSLYVPNNPTDPDVVIEPFRT